MNIDEIRNALRARRNELGWSQEALTFTAGLSRRGVQDTESGRRNPRLLTVLWMAEALGLEVVVRRKL